MDGRRRTRMETRFRRRERREAQRLRRRVERLQALTKKGLIPDISQMPLEPPYWLTLREGQGLQSCWDGNKFVRYIEDHLCVGDHDTSQVALPSDYSETEAECTCDSDCDPGEE